MRKTSARLVAAAAIAVAYVLIPVEGRADFYDGLRAFDAEDYAEAADEWTPEAQAGVAKAQYRLAKLYEDGLGVAQNFVKAHLWFNLAAAQGHEKARKAREALAARMAAGQVARAQKLAADWKPSSAAKKQPQARAGKEAEDQEGLGRKAGGLFDAAENGDVGAVEAAIRDGVDPDTSDADGWTPLMYAAVQGHAAVVEALIEAGADVNAQSKDRVTALMTAVATGRTAVVERLLDTGAKPGVENAAGVSAARIAERRGFDDIAALLAGGDTDKTDDAKIAPKALFAAAAEGDAARVARLLDAGIDAGAQDEKGWTALHFAAARGHAAAAAKLIAAGASVDHQAYDGTTPLMLAALEAHTAVAEALLEAGADPERRNREDPTAADIADARGHQRMHDLLSPAYEPPAHLIRSIQANLNCLGYAAGPVDGILGTKTRSAIAAFRENNGLSDKPDSKAGYQDIERRSECRANAQSGDAEEASDESPKTWYAIPYSKSPLPALKVAARKAGGRYQLRITGEYPDLADVEAEQASFYSQKWNGEEWVSTDFGETIYGDWARGREFKIYVEVPAAYIENKDYYTLHMCIGVPDLCYPIELLPG